MAILEIDYHAGDSDRAPMAHIQIDGMAYMLLGGRGSVTVIAGRWINDRRSLGKTFWTPAALAEHYKRHGSILLEYANRLTHWN